MPLSQHNLSIPARSYPPLQPLRSDVKFSWLSECRYLFSSRPLHLLWWPLFLFRQRNVTRSPLFQQCKPLPGFTDLWKTIQKGSFAYNSLFLGLTPFQRSANTELADITTLALFFGDEFIDGMAAQAGKSTIRQLVRNKPDRFCLKKKFDGKQVILYYCFDPNLLFSPSVLQAINPKYGITYQHFHNLLNAFLQLINDKLAALPVEKAGKAAGKIAETCNTCLKSYLRDIFSNPVPGHIALPAEVMNFHELKTAYMQTSLLELRCILAGKEDAMTGIQTPGWLNIMRVVQIYDDIHDALLDDGLQDNLLLSVAAHYFPDEWEWFCRNKQHALQEDDNPLLFSLYMPCSMEYCHRLAGTKIRTMNWEQQKIMHYLVFKNKYVLYHENKGEDLQYGKDFISGFFREIKDRMPQHSLQSVKNYVVDTCIHLPGVRNRLLSRVSPTVAYQLRYNLLALDPARKATIYDTVTGQ